MKKIHFPLATLVVVLVAYGVGLRAHAQTTTTQTNDGAESRTFHQRYITAFNKMDVATIMSYLPGAGLFAFGVTPPRQHVGWANYKKDWEDLFATFPGPVRNEISDLSITTEGNLGFPIISTLATSRVNAAQQAAGNADGCGRRRGSSSPSRSPNSTTCSWRPTSSPVPGKGGPSPLKAARRVWNGAACSGSAGPRPATSCPSGPAAATGED